MKKILPLILINFVLYLYGYGQIIENGGFENWEDAGTVKDEPVDWSSIKTSDAGGIINSAAPAVWGESTDAHTGNYSVRLENLTAIPGIIATGTITNGRVHADYDPDSGFVYTNQNDPKWNTPCDKRPDSLVGWFKYFPQGQDIGRVQALLHVGQARIPENGTQSNWVGMATFETQPGQTVNTWTRFAVPFNYFDNRTPEHLLIILNSGDGTTPVEGSYILFDDLKLVGGSLSIKENSLSGLSGYYSGNAFHFINLPEKMLGKARFQLFDLTGRLVIDQLLVADIQSFGLLKPHPGIYTVRLLSDNIAFSRKINIW